MNSNHFPLLPKMGVQNALMAKILLGTAVRLGELVGAKWENVDFENKTWFIPPTDIKGKKGKPETETTFAASSFR
jgi:integrase